MSKYFPEVGSFFYAPPLHYFNKKLGTLHQIKKAAIVFAAFYIRITPISEDYISAMT